MTEPKIAAFGKLQRDLGLLDAVGIGLGAVIGAGIFVVTGVAAVFPQSGGTYEYGYRVLNPRLGYSAGLMFLASKLAAGGVVALGFGSYLSQLMSLP